MPLKRLRKAGDAEQQKPAARFLEDAQDIVESDRAPRKRKAPESERTRRVVQQKRGDHVSEARPAAKPPRPPASGGVPKAAAESQPKLRSLDRSTSGDLAASDSGLKGSDLASDEEETFEERSDDRANDPACIECDDGGDIMWCDGSCMRAVHCGVQFVAPDDSDESDSEQLVPSDCNPLRMPLDLYQHLKDTKDVFHCPNCLTGVHQCFKCKVEGVEASHQADPQNKRFAQRLVFRCGVASCGRFYHEDCMELTADDMEGGFFCPLHTCKCCGQDESTAQNELIPCRRCPKAYHEHCMPPKLCTPRDEKKSENFKQRIWIAQFENGECISEVERSLIYCSAHKIQSDRNNPEHPRPIFHPSLLQRWHEHFAQAFPDLTSSKLIRKQMEDEDKPLAQRRRPSSADATPAAPTPASKLFQASTPQTAVAHQAKHAAEQAADKPSNTQQLAAQAQASTGAAKQSSAELAKSKSASLAQAASKQTTAKPSGIRMTVGSKKSQVVQSASHQGRDSQAAKLQRSSSGKSAVAGTQAGTQAANLKRPSDTAAAVKPASTAAIKGGLSFLDAPTAQKADGAATAAVSTGTASMGPPPARKRPALPDRSALPPKKRRAVPAAAAEEVKAKGQDNLVSAQGKATDTTRSQQPSQAAEPIGDAPSTSISAKPSSAEAPVPSSTAAAKALRAANSTDSSKSAPGASKHAGRATVSPAGLQSLEEHQSPVQVVHQEDIGDVDIADDTDFGLASDMPQAASDAADADANADITDKVAVSTAEAAPVMAAATKAAKAKRSHSEAFATAADSEAKAEGRTAPEVAARDQGDAAAAPEAAKLVRKAGAKTARVEGGKSARLEAAEAAAPPRPMDVPHEFARQLRVTSLEQRKAEAAKRLQALFDAGPSLATALQRVKAATRQPEPYCHPSKTTITEERLKVAEQAVANAISNPGRAHTIMDPGFARELLMHQDNMDMVMAPFLHGKRYSSYGRHFTKEHLLLQVAQLLSFYLHDGDTIVDFSCGANAFVPLVKQEGSKQGLSLKGRAFDIITSQNLEDFDRRSWLDTRRGMLPHGDTLVIGLNPPFGKNNVLAKKFTQHAADQFRPRVIVLIVPPSTPIPRNYVVMYEDCSTMRDRSFYVPGATAESWNLITPALRVLVRSDWVNRPPLDGSGWFPTPHAGPPRYGSRRCPPPHPMQPPFPHMPPQQPPPWQQGPHLMPPQQINQQQLQQQQLPQPPWQQPHRQQFPPPWQHAPQQHMPQQGGSMHQPPGPNVPQHALGAPPWHHGHQL